MKKLILFSFLLLSLTLKSSSQEWSPLKLSEEYSYRLTGAAVISNIIKADSTALIYGDSVFYLNRIVIPCPACPDTTMRLKNQPQFLKKRMIKKPGGVYIFEDPGRVLIKTLAETGSSWVFDTISAISAQVTQKTTAVILGEQDSVKTIELSNGKIILLSKNHGITSYPVMTDAGEYLLEGIDEMELGVIVPGFDKIFNFNVGDIFQYESKWQAWSTPYGGNGGMTVTKNKIISKTVTDSGFIYESESIGFNCTLLWGIEPVDTTYFISPLTQSYSQNDYAFCNLNPEGLIESIPDENYSGYSGIMHLYSDTGNHINRFIGLYDGEPFSTASLYHQGNGDTLNGSVILYSRHFAEGLGEIKEHVYDFEYEHQFKLVGYVKDGDTTGIIFPDEILMAVPSVQTVKMNLWPNPAQDFVFLYAIEKNPVKVEILNSSGSTVLSRDYIAVNDKIVIDIRHLNTGLYILRCGNYTSKLIIK